MNIQTSIPYLTVAGSSGMCQTSWQLAGWSGWLCKSGDTWQKPSKIKESKQKMSSFFSPETHIPHPPAEESPGRLSLWKIVRSIFSWMNLWYFWVKNWVVLTMQVQTRRKIDEWRWSKEILHHLFKINKLKWDILLFIYIFYPNDSQLHATYRIVFYYQIIKITKLLFLLYWEKFYKCWHKG